MANKNFSLIDIQNDDQEIDLEFQDFGNTSTKSALPGKESVAEQTVYFSNFPDSHEDDQERLLGEESEPQHAKPGHSFWTFEYYQQFLNVESKQVGDRIIWSMLPKPGVNYLQSYIRPNPDLYGPFWICVTLVFTTAITGNLANYLQTPDSYKWRYDFHKVTLATSCIFSYSWIVPLFLWGLLLLRGSKASLSLLELICLYGYSLAIFVPVSLLWMIPLKWLQWCLGIVASVLSGSVLVRTIHPAISHEAKRIALTIAAVILVLHAVLALGFMLYFFYPPNVDITSAEPIQQHNNQTIQLNKNVNDLVKNISKGDLDVVKHPANKPAVSVDKKKDDSVRKRADSQFSKDVDSARLATDTKLAKRLTLPNDSGTKLKNNVTLENKSSIEVATDKILSTNPILTNSTNSGEGNFTVIVPKSVSASNTV